MTKSWGRQGKRDFLFNSLETASLFLEQLHYFSSSPLLPLPSKIRRTLPIHLLDVTNPRDTGTWGFIPQRYLEFWARARDLAPKLRIVSLRPNLPLKKQILKCQKFSAHFTHHRRDMSTSYGWGLTMKKRKNSAVRRSLSRRWGVGVANGWRGPKCTTSSYKISKS